MKTLTPAQKEASDARKARFRAFVKQVANMPDIDKAKLAARMTAVTVEGRSLSLCNLMLLALQCPQATVVGGFRQWIKQGRAVRKGEHGAMIWCPAGARKGETMPAAVEPADGEAAGESVRFIVGTVFDVSQTDEIQTEAQP